jgi:hypothetical protein
LSVLSDTVCLVVRTEELGANDVIAVGGYLVDGVLSVLHRHAMVSSGAWISAKVSFLLEALLSLATRRFTIQLLRA